MTHTAPTPGVSRRSDPGRTEPGRSDPQHAEGTRARGATLEQERHDGPFATVVWNDPVNLMSYVVYVFRSHFGYSRAHAHELMRRVHEQGRATVSRGSREKVESDVQAMHGYGLRATIERSGEA